MTQFMGKQNQEQGQGEGKAAEECVEVEKTFEEGERIGIETKGGEIIFEVVDHPRTSG